MSFVRLINSAGPADIATASRLAGVLQAWKTGRLDRTAVGMISALAEAAQPTTVSVNVRVIATVLPGNIAPMGSLESGKINASHTKPNVMAVRMTVSVGQPQIA